MSQDMRHDARQSGGLPLRGRAVQENAADLLARRTAGRQGLENLVFGNAHQSMAFEQANRQIREVRQRSRFYSGWMKTTHQALVATTVLLVMTRQRAQVLQEDLLFSLLGDRVLRRGQKVVKPHPEGPSRFAAIASSAG